MDLLDKPAPQDPAEQQPLSHRQLAEETSSGGERQLPAPAEAQQGCRRSRSCFHRSQTPQPVSLPHQLPHCRPINLGGTRCRIEGRRLRAHTIGGVCGIKSNEFWEMFLGAFESSLHIAEFNWAAADERPGLPPRTPQPSPSVQSPPRCHGSMASVSLLNPHTEPSTELCQKQTWVREDTA